MTVIAVEQSVSYDIVTGEPHDGLLIVADSRITRGRTVTTDIASKILPIPMAIMRDGSPRNWFSPYGFAFAGSVNSALLTHSTAIHCLMNLFSNVRDTKPTVEEVSMLYADIAEKHIRAIGTSLPTDSAKAALFEAVVCGQSGDPQHPSAFHIASTIEPSLSIALSNIDLKSGPFRIGSGSAEFDRIRAQLRSDGKDHNCIPVLRQMIDTKANESVGGFIQVGQIGRDGFFSCGMLEAVEDKMLSKQTYLGIDLADLPRPLDMKYGQMAIAFGENSTRQEIKTAM
ncbi:MAG: hypothetical protein ACTHOP_12590 [Mesorhizobium sp.]